jgi:hypothetical protein
MEALLISKLQEGPFFGIDCYLYVWIEGLYGRMGNLFNK